MEGIGLPSARPRGVPRAELPEAIPISLPAQDPAPEPDLVTRSGGWTTLARSATRSDLAWAAFVATLLALSPLTGAHRVVPSIVLGCIGGVVVLFLRLRRFAQTGRPESRPTFAAVAPAVSAALLLMLLVFAPTLLWLYDEYTESIWRTPHGLFVPFFIALCIRHRLRERADPEPRSSAWGFALLVPGCLLAMLDAGIRSHYLALLGAILALPGLSLLLLGTAATRRIAFPLALCVFLVPLPDGLADPAGLPSLSAQVAELMARAFGVSVERTGSYLRLATGLLIEVSQNCSGLSFFYGGCAFAAFAIGTTRSWPRRLALAASPYGLAVLMNGVRVGLLLVVGDRLGLDWKYNTPIHGLLGTGVFWCMIIGIWLLSDRRALREAIS